MIEELASEVAYPNAFVALTVNVYAEPDDKPVTSALV